MLEEVVVIFYVEERLDLIWFELWTVAFETYFAESAKNCEQQSFAPVNQLSFLRLLQIVYKRKFHDVRRGGRHCLCWRKAWFHLKCER